VELHEIVSTGIDKVPPPMFNSLMSGVQGLHGHYQSLREVRDYATPKGLRHFAVFLIVTTPVLLAPFWMSFCSGSPKEGEEWEDGNTPYGCFAGYFMAFLYVVITFCLLRVQEALEDPFDGTGEDDIQWNCFARNLDAINKHGSNGKELRKTPDDTEAYQAADAKKD